MTDIEYFKLIQTNSETSSTSGESSLFSKTLIIFDFDDTLFCTKYFDTFTLSYQDIFTCKTSLEEINPCLVRELKEFKSSLSIFKTKVELTHEPLKNIFDELSNTNNGNISNFFRIVSKNMENTNAGNSWIEALGIFKTNLNKEDIEVLKGLGSLLRKS